MVQFKGYGFKVKVMVLTDKKSFLLQKSDRMQVCAPLRHCLFYIYKFVSYSKNSPISYLSKLHYRHSVKSVG